MELQWKKLKFEKKKHNYAKDTLVYVLFIYCGAFSVPAHSYRKVEVVQLFRSLEVSLVSNLR